MTVAATLPRASAPTPQDAAGPGRATPPSEAGRRVARNLGALLGGQAITWTVTLAWTVVVPRALGPAQLGILISAQSVSGVLGIVLGMGTRNYLVREVVTHPGEGPGLVGTALVLRVAIAPLVAAAAVVWAHLAGEHGRAATVLYLITAMTVLTLITEPLQAAFQAIERMKYLAYADIINKSAQSLIGIGLVLVGFDAVGIAANMAIIAVVVLVLTFWWLRPHFAVDVRTSLARIGHMTRESASYWAFGLFGMVYFWIDTIMLSLMTRPHVVGWYGVPSQLFQTLMFLPTLVQTAWLPRLVAAFASGDGELAKTARAPVELILSIGLPIAVATALVADPLIHVVYGTAFSQAVPVLMILAVCVPPIYLNIILASVLLAAGRQRVWTGVMAGAAVVNPLMNLVLIPLTERRYGNGAIGASIALVLTEVLMMAVGLGLVGPDVFERRMVRRCALMCVASAGMAGIAYAARPLGTEVSLGAGFAALAVLAPGLGAVRREELTLARAGLARLRGRAQTGEGTAGAVAARLQLGELLDGAPSRERDLCVALILRRALLAAAPFDGAPAPMVLGGETAADAGEDELDAAIDWLLERREAIEDRLAARHLTGGLGVLYDASRPDSGDLWPVGEPGSSRARGRGRLPLARGLLCDADGRPVALEPLIGRRRDASTLRSRAARCRRRFGLSGVVIVGDSGLFTKADVDELSAADGVDWVAALSGPMIARLARAGMLGPAPAGSAAATDPARDGPEQIWEIPCDGRVPGARLIAVRDLSLAARRATRRDELLAATESELAAIAASVDDGALRGAARIWLAVGPALNRHRMREHLRITVTDESLAYARDTAGITAAAALDGVSVLWTSLAPAAAPPERVVRLHGNLARAGRTLRSAEDPGLNRLPRRHPEDRAHALITMLADHVVRHLIREPSDRGPAIAC